MVLEARSGAQYRTLGLQLSTMGMISSMSHRLLPRHYPAITPPRRGSIERLHWLVYRAKTIGPHIYPLGLDNFS